MKRIIIVMALAMLAAAGCKKPTGPKTTEIEAVDRPASELMPETPATENTTRTETATESTTDATDTTTDPPPPARTHTVRKGDTLWSLAMKFYGDGKRWREIAQANNIEDETKLPIGKVLTIP